MVIWSLYGPCLRFNKGFDKGGVDKGFDKGAFGKGGFDKGFDKPRGLQLYPPTRPPPIGFMGPMDPQGPNTCFGDLSYFASRVSMSGICSMVHFLYSLLLEAAFVVRVLCVGPVALGCIVCLGRASWYGDPTLVDTGNWIPDHPEMIDV